jgi:hypothetical protein
LDQSRHITVHSSSNVQIGNANVQDVSIEIEKVIAGIDSSPAPESEKTEAKSLLKKFLEHPLVASIAGGLGGQSQAVGPQRLWLGTQIAVVDNLDHASTCQRERNRMCRLVAQSVANSRCIPVAEKISFCCLDQTIPRAREA